MMRLNLGLWTSIRHFAFLVIVLSGSTFSALAVPPNDNFANAVVLTGQDVAVIGSNIDATEEAGEPQTVKSLGNDRSPLGGKSVWWKWTAPVTARFTIKTGDKALVDPSSDFDTQLGVYTGTNVANLVEVASNESDVAFPSGTSKVEINAKIGTTYYILVDGREGQVGTIQLYLVRTRYTLAVGVTPFEAGNLTVDPEPPADGYLAGTTVTVTAVPVGDATFFGWTGDISASTNPVHVVMNDDKTVIAHFAFDRQIFWQHTNGALGVWFMATNQFLRSASLGNNPNWRLATCSDFDENNSTDLLFQNTNGAVQLWLMSGLTRQSETVIAEPRSAWRLIDAKDFNDDTKPDLVFQNKDGRVVAWIMNGTEVTTNVIHLGRAVGWRLMAAADLDGDDDLDLIFQRTSGQISIWTMQGNSKQSATLLSAMQTSWRVVAARDFDNDGDSDLLFQHKSGRVAVWIMQGMARQGMVVLRDGKSAGPAWKARAAR